MANTPGAAEALNEYVLAKDFGRWPWELREVPAREVRRLSACQKFLSWVNSKPGPTGPPPGPEGPPGAPGPPMMEGPPNA